LNKKGQQPRNFVWVREQNKVKQADKVNVVFIKDKDDAQFLELPCQESPKHQRVAMIDSEMCGEVQVNSPQSLNGDLTLEQEPS